VVHAAPPRAVSDTRRLLSGRFSSLIAESSAVGVPVLGVSRPNVLVEPVLDGFNPKAQAPVDWHPV
jgi:hypothetical protein